MQYGDFQEEVDIFNKAFYEVLMEGDANGKPFTFYKIRTLIGIAHADWETMQKSETQFGAWLRRTKLDELPQIFSCIIHIN